MTTKKPIVVVRWDDAQASATKVITENEPSYHAAITMETLGWLLRDDEIGVSIVNEAFFEEGTMNYRGHTFVPRAMVREVIHLPTKTVRRKRDTSTGSTRGRDQGTGSGGD